MPRLSGRVSSRVVRHDERQAPAWALWPKCGACAWCRGRQSEPGVRLAPICPAWSVVAELAFAPLLVRAEGALRCRPRRNRRRMGAYRFADRDGESERRRSLRLAQGNSRSHRRRPPEQLARRRASLELPELVKLIAGAPPASLTPHRPAALKSVLDKLENSRKCLFWRNGCCQM